MSAGRASQQRTFLSDAVEITAMGVRSLESDDFSRCFRPARRTAMQRSGVLYVFSFIARYFVLFPLRLAVLLVGSALAGLCLLYGIYAPSEAAVSASFTFFFKVLVAAFNCRVRHRGLKRALKVPHVYVANHTSFIDFIILSSYKFCHASIAEDHGGLFSFIFNTILSRNGSIAFKRSERGNREEALRRIKAHVKENRTPMLIFPEGTVVNNEYAVLFQKGAFELGATVCPVGIRYKKRLMDPYWNRRGHCFTLHLFYLMTRWRIDADVFWLKPVQCMPDESPFEFSHRVKSVIAKAVGLKNTLWNGYFKSSSVIKDRVLFKAAYRNAYASYTDGTIARVQEADRADGRAYMHGDDIYCSDEDGRLYFGSVTYSAFINECCREYLRLKMGNAINVKDQLRVLELRLKV
ncbi:glycerol-3-phosphate O-acyltransferase 3/4 [Pancytospora philotis]|nr:glycerol-3-phosphate O-acyltransferase 3/4 [Pancytospora philotis]